MRSRQVRGYALFSGEDGSMAARISAALAGIGVEVSRFDPDDGDGVLRAADRLRADSGIPIVLIGQSAGGAAIVAAAQRIPEVRAVVTIAAPATEPLDVPLLTLLTNPLDDEFVATTVAVWVARQLVAPDDGEGIVVVTESGESRLAQRITVGRHVLTADEPVPVGLDGGPTPYDLLLAALGTCTSMTVRLYADRKKWPLDNVTVRLRHSRIHATDCADCETRIGLLDRIDRTITLTGDLDDAQRRRLMEIADKCPVHRTLHSEIVTETRESTMDDRPA